ncbi:hypothetical protein A6M21_01845 [Desulfotomaculum copahuensis]|uniref:Uncharacterized protein n=1 Tax=Desulfotomaculum copahuensis TaxID=1838280 RepID=A0A1B7LKG1_9FIRM|nr:hypothetical protein A6M21_01845 [Desulfotomaculum copahuensis]
MFFLYIHPAAAAAPSPAHPPYGGCFPVSATPPAKSKRRLPEKGEPFPESAFARGPPLDCRLKNKNAFCR